MIERVEPLDLLESPLWDPNAPDAVLVSDDQGRGALAQRAHPDDPDQRCVVLRWDVVWYSLIGPPNDEARQHHRLYEAGLRDVDLIGVVRHSALIEFLRPMRHSRAMFSPLHYVVLSKECTVEVVAENVDVVRIGGSPRQAGPMSFLP